MIIIGITGSIGMGKTTVSKMLRILNIPVFDSDKTVKEILDKNYDIIEKISGDKLNESSIKAAVEDISKKNLGKYL